MAIEVQQALGCGGCLRHERGLLVGHALAYRPPSAPYPAARPRAVLMVSAEITSGHLNFCDRDSRFIFGDACTAVVLERADTARSERGLSAGLQTGDAVFQQYPQQLWLSQPRRQRASASRTSLFVQQGLRGVQEVCPMVAGHIEAHPGQPATAPATSAAIGCTRPICR